MISNVENIHKKRICLRMWAFKFVEYEENESFGVCVEGYRPTDRTETILRNWYSTPIQERISNSLLVSRSGSVYELRGHIDKDLAYHYGYPAKLVDMFTDGFPEDWSSILKRYFHAIKTNLTSMSHYPGFFASRRSLQVERGRNAFSGDNSISSEQDTRRSIAPPPTTLSSTANYEMEIEEKENGLDEHVVSNNAKRFGKGSCSKTRRNSSINNVTIDRSLRNSTNLASVNRTMLDIVKNTEELQCTISSSLTSNKLVSSNKDDSRPIVQSPTSISSQSLNQDLSAGPLYKTPSNVLSMKDIAAEQSNSEAVFHGAVLPKFPDVSRVPAIRRYTYEAGDAIELSEWSIRFAPIGYGNLTLGFPKFVVLGNKEGHLTQWQTSIVTRVESADIFYTMSTKYRLVGNINILDSATAGFPKEFVAKFIHGFPPDWRTTITDLYNRFIWHLQANGEFSNPDDDIHHSAINIKDNNNLQSFRNESEIKPTRRKSSAKHCDSSVISHKSFSRKVEAAANCAHIHNFFSYVRRSRSGRCSRPPLVQCAGQRVRYDGYGNVIGVENITNDSVHSKGTVNITDLCKYYGLPSNKTSKESQDFRQLKEVPIVQRSIKPLMSSNNRLTPSDDDCSWRSLAERDIHICRDLEVESVSSESEQQLRMKRRIILNKARQLQKEQERLLEMERRLAIKEKRRKNWSGVGKLTQNKELLYDYPDGRRKVRDNVKDCHNNERYCSKLKKQRKRLEEEWTRQDEELSESFSEERSWRKPVRKKRKMLSKKTKTKISSDTSSTDPENNERKENVESNGTKESYVKLPVKKEKCWTKTELQRLKLALAAIHVCTDEDWEKISRSLGSKRDSVSCKQAAIKRLKWKPPDSNVNPSPKIHSKLVTARVGTIAHHHQTNEYTRKFMMDGDVQGEDYFIHNTTNITNSIPDVTNFCADDSLLNVINTPEEAAVRRRGNLRGQFLPEAIDDGSSGSSKSSEIRVLTPVDSVQRERQARYCHYILNKGGGRKDISRTNFSRVGDSSRFERNREEEIRNVGTFENLREGLENVAKVIKKSSRRDAFMDESDLQLESDKGNFESSENSF